MDQFTSFANNVSIDTEQITIFGEKKGKKINTYIIGINQYPHAGDVDMKHILENMKKKFGCGGSIKTVNYENRDWTAVHLQGDQLTKAFTCLNALNMKNVSIKNLIS